MTIRSPTGSQIERREKADSGIREVFVYFCSDFGGLFFIKKRCMC